ncbi:uncharacterized protein ATC70_003112 [Mucor velutinosus]|uniref:RFX-type winged-helix domain-containing protein n=1 Tax=Mucor velutinosus TaxID=708070 RepID=A0AAN7D8E6_9FUNG|nr:hypothetical protein ATC70_003112 [Mucor velutinosus]
MTEQNENIQVDDGPVQSSAEKDPSYIVSLASSEPESVDPNVIADREASLQVTSWIQANYIREKNHNVPRKNMYEHYQSSCAANHLTPVNSATFGKLLRNVFPDLKTRRLGTRGQSKYHYCGIRVRTSQDPEPIPIVELMQEHAAVSGSNKRRNSHRRSLTSGSIATVTTVSSTDASSSAAPSTPTAPTLPSSTTSGITGDYNQLPIFSLPLLPPYRYNDQITNGLIVDFTNAYEQHCKNIFNLVCSNQVESIQHVMLAFYREMPERFIYLIQMVPEITDSIWRWDCILYDTLISRFLPTIHHALSQETVNALRLYTREIRDYVESSLIHYPTTLVQKKADVARIFSAKFRRQLTLNFAAQNAANILNHQHLVNAMCHDWNNFDVDGILDQTLWVCDCDTQQIRHILRTEIYQLLNNKPSIEHWMFWLGTLIDKYVNNSEPSSLNEANLYLSKCKQFLLKWNFYTALVMKDLANQQAPSFASFHTLRLFLDDYILYLVEENISRVNHHIMQRHQLTHNGGGGGASTASSTSASFSHLSNQD